MIFFNVNNVKNCLIKNGEVYTLRKKRRDGLDIAVTGNRYKWNKLGKVDIIFVKEIKSFVDLIDYLPLSGMPHAKYWYKLASKLHKSKDLFLYNVKFLGEDKI